MSTFFISYIPRISEIDTMYSELVERLFKMYLYIGPIVRNRSILIYVSHVFKEVSHILSKVLKWFVWFH